MRQGRAAIVAQLTELVASLEHDETETAVGLHELVDRGVRHVSGCRYAGITLADESKSVFNVAATHRYPMVLDAIQNRCGEGPCVPVAWRHHTIHIDDPYVEKRWPW